MPRYAILSDIHGNINALKVCISELEKYSPDIWINLGDVVGYGPYPNECIDIVREKNFESVLGNHDCGIIGKVSLKHFKNPNRLLIEKSMGLVSDDNKKWLSGLPLKIENEDYIAVHASVSQPEKWQYIESAFVARDILASLEKQFCFVGHTHKVALVCEKIGINRFKRGYKYLINPGSVGQSRDTDYRASCSFIDTESFEYINFRLDYESDPMLTALDKLGFTRKESKRLLRL